MTQLVQILLTPEQAALLGASADVTVRAHEAETLVELTDDEKSSYQQLAVFMGMVASDPSKFPVTGKLARTIKTRARQLKATPNPDSGNTNASRRNKRKARQERRQRSHKVRRRTRREDAAAYNVARTQMEAEIAEMQAIQDERMAEIEAEPKFTVTDIMGNVLIDNVPQSMIAPVVGPDDDAAERFREQYEDAVPGPAPKIILPGTAEALGVTLTSDDIALD